MPTQDETDSRRMTECRLCGNLVPAADLHQHLLADARLLRLIKANNPGWDRDLCEGYLRSLGSGYRPPEWYHRQASQNEAQGAGGLAPRPSPQADDKEDA